MKTDMHESCCAAIMSEKRSRWVPQPKGNRIDGAVPPLDDECMCVVRLLNDADEHADDACR